MSYIAISQYLIISPGPKRWSPKVKLVRSLKGNMPANSVAIKLNLSLPESLFQKPQLQATIKINENDVSKPVINAEVLDNIKQELQKNLGVEMSINVIEEE